MNRQRHLTRKRISKQRKHVQDNPGELLVFGQGTAAVKQIWKPELKGESGFWITGDDVKPAAPEDQS